MPQLVRSKDHERLKMLWDTRALLQRPNLARHIATIAAMWTQVEINIGHILSAMCGIQFNISTAIYVALVSTSARIDALNAIAETRLNKKTQEKLALLLKEFRKRSKERNNIVHGLWGISETDTKCLLHQDPADHTLMVAEALFARRPQQSSPKFRRKSVVYQYSEPDFIAIERRILKLKNDAWNFSHQLSERRWRRRLAWLKRAPRQSQALALLGSHHKTSP